MPAAGQLRDRVAVQHNTTTVDAYGQPAAGWADVGVFWADVRMIESTSATRAVTHLVRMRAGEVAPARLTHRLVFAGLVLDILRVLDVDHRGAELRLECQERLADG